MASLNQPLTGNKRYFNEQGLGQHAGFGIPSATAEVPPKAKSSSVVTTILRIVFMFSPCDGFHFLRQSIASGPRRKSRRCVFSNLPNERQVLAADWLSDTLACPLRYTCIIVGDFLRQRVRGGHRSDLGSSAAVRQFGYAVGQIVGFVSRSC